MTVFIINMLFIKIKLFVVNWFQWHKKLQHLFRGALYNKPLCKKHGAPLPRHSLGNHFVRGIILRRNL